MKHQGIDVQGAAVVVVGHMLDRYPDIWRGLWPAAVRLARQRGRDCVHLVDIWRAAETQDLLDLVVTQS